MILLIDNYDSFTYNLAHLIQGQTDEELQVVRNDVLSLADIEILNPSRIFISPGPGRPEDAGLTLEIIKYFAGKIPIFGVCLGHQSIAQIFGGKVIRAKQLMHGKTSQIQHEGNGIFESVEDDFQAARYHSLVVEKTSFPDQLEVTSTTSDGIIMGLRHKDFPVEGIQFHPESFQTPAGGTLIKNWLVATQDYQPNVIAS